MPFIFIIKPETYQNQKTTNENPPATLRLPFDACMQQITYRKLISIWRPNVLYTNCKKHTWNANI